MKIVFLDVISEEVIQLFSEQDDFMIDFLGDDSVYYTRYSKNENIKNVWVAYFDDLPIGCAAYRKKSIGVGEVKRMFIKKEYRGRGISKSLLDMVEQYAKHCGDHTLHLSTRITLEPAITLYRHSGFFETFRNGLYVEMEKKL
jgi:putative acetyltransferase